MPSLPTLRVLRNTTAHERSVVLWRNSSTRNAWWAGDLMKDDGPLRAFSKEDRLQHLLM
jgi:hypothetical protein